MRWVSDSAAAYGVAPVGQLISELVHPDDLGRAMRPFQVAESLDSYETARMANSIMSVRIVTPDGDVPFDTSGRWAKTDDGEWWMVAILYEITTRYATDQALRILAAGASEHEAVEAILAATLQYGGVIGAQMVWRDLDGSLRTAGDLGDDPDRVVRVIGGIGPLPAVGTPVTVEDSNWGHVLPVNAGSDRLGIFVVWGEGPPPDGDYVFAALGQLLDIAALAFKRARETAELERRASTDLVTGLLNRHAFFSALDEPLLRSAVMYIDLDAFKAVNDRFGHTLGDRLLAVVSRRLVDAVGHEDLIGRLGGDEFGVLCRSVSAADARQAGQRLVDALNQTFVIDGHHMVTGASIGVAYTSQPMSGRTLLDYADQALLEAKAQGKGRSVVLSAL